ncbi:MAG TPA: hypothetical protein VFL41_09935 [Gaiellaceae bacterium]|nr:hypothetical protein [Gaiellaceae bacterium]HET8652410.1 hypothetical protein [Gaiellaceae bacterium]
MIATTALISAFSLLGMPGGALLDHDRAVWLGWLTLALAAYALAHSLLLLWTESDAGLKVLLSGIAYTVACSHAAATTSRRRDTDPPSVRVLYVAAIVGTVLAATLAAYAALAEVEDNEGFYRFLGALAVADVLATVLQPVLRRAGRESRQRDRFSVRLVTADGRELERTLDAPDFAAAAAQAIRETERTGETVTRVERE